MNESSEIVIVLDRSGSMASIKADMEGGLNQFIEEQKKEPGECKVTLTQFDTEYAIVFSGLELKDVPAITLVPRGGTALHDALVRTIHEVIARHKSAGDAAPKRTLCLIITDGQENSSKESTLEDVKKLVDERRAAGWEFVYLGANQDAFAVGARLGISQSSDFQGTKAGVQRMATNASKGVSNYRSGGKYTE